MVEQLRRSLFEKALAELDSRYDDTEKMLKVPLHSRGYHTTLKRGMVHPNRESIVYALALLDLDRDDLLERAEAVLRTVISHQDTNPEHDTYGIWSYHLEEDLETMSPPDWNWADFIGKELLAVAIRHGERISAATKKAVDEAIYHAAQSIRRRNMGPHYTNISIMGTYVTHVYAERYSDGDMLAYAKERLQNILGYTKHNGAFTEYNSPTYNLLATTDLGRMRADVRDVESLEAVEWLHDFSWKNIAIHFHPATQQWAGPHSRSYADIQGPQFYTVLYLATDGNVEIIDTPKMELRTDLYRVPIHCPEKYWRVIMDPAERQIRERYIADDPDCVATTYLAADHTVGSFYKSHYWNQSRPVIAYWDNEDEPTCLTAQFLHDGYDFCSALSVNVQEKDRLVGAVCFATDNGDTHPGLDPIRDASIDASDLRMRFKVSGKHDNVEVSVAENDTIVFIDGTHTTAVRILFAAFSDVSHTIEIGHDADSDWADVVLFNGRSRRFRLPNLNPCVVGFGLVVNAESVESVRAATAAEHDGAQLVVSLCDETVSMQLAVPVIPAAKSEIFARTRGEISGRSFGE